MVIQLSLDTLAKYTEACSDSRVANFYDIKAFPPISDPVPCECIDSDIIRTDSVEDSPSEKESGEIKDDDKSSDSQPSSPFDGLIRFSPKAKSINVKKGEVFCLLPPPKPKIVEISINDGLDVFTQSELETLTDLFSYEAFTDPQSRPILDQLAPKHPIARITRSLWHFFQRDYQACVKSIDDILAEPEDKDNPFFEQPRRLLANYIKALSYFRSGDYQECIETCKAMLETQHNKCYHSLSLKGIAHYQAKQQTSAIITLSESLYLEPSDMINRWYVAQASIALGDFDIAISELEEISYLDEFGEADYNIACLQTKKAQHKKAAEHLKKAFEKNPSLYARFVSDSDFKELGERIKQELQDKWGQYANHPIEIEENTFLYDWQQIQSIVQMPNHVNGQNQFEPIIVVPGSKYIFIGIAVDKTNEENAVVAHSVPGRPHSSFTSIIDKEAQRSFPGVIFVSGDSVGYGISLTTCRTLKKGIIGKMNHIENYSSPHED